MHHRPYAPNRPWKLIAIALLSSLLGLGCGDKKSAPGQPGTAAAAGEAAPPAGEARAVSLIVDGYNELTAETARDVIDSYRDRGGVGPDVPASDKLDAIRLRALTVNYDRALEGATKKFAEAKTLAATLPLTATAEQLGAAAAPLAEAYRQSARYYDSDEYKSDGGAKVAELHTTFMAKLDAYRQAVRAVAAALDERENAEMVKELAKFQPTTYSYWFRKILMDAKAVIVASKDLATPARLTAANDAYQQTAKGLDAFTTSKGPDVNKAFAALRRQAVENLATRSAAVVRALAEPTPNTIRIEGDLDTMVQYYNGLVQTVNGLYEAEAKGYLK